MKTKILLISGIICIYPILLGNSGPVLGTATPMFHGPDPLAGSLGVTAWGDHLVISEILYNASPGNKDSEFIEIYNPTPFNVTLDNYILGEDTGYKDSAVYYNKTSWDPSADEEPFWRFPTGYDINSGKYLVVAKNGTAFKARFPTLDPTFEVIDTSSAPDMVRITGANAWNWSDDDECILAFDDSGTIRDVDIIVWGAGSWVNRTEAASPSNKEFYNYNACNGSKLPNVPANDWSFARISLSAEYKESFTPTEYGMPDGSGNYHDETSEDYGVSITAMQSHWPTADPPGIPEIGIPAPLAIVTAMGIFLGITFLKKKRKEI